ncbi:TIGR00375 family protein [Xylanibacillus composti]|nr:endonuclease Q family protein [Xylanibacillus composti]MDT9726657.1 TIGR00375 family protein [Xylanibacillus composti]
MAEAGQGELRRIFADFHIHIGRTAAGKPVKISGSRDLTFANIAYEASERKGIGLIGIIDCHSPAVLEEIDALVSAGEMEEVPGGGLRYRDTVVLLGSEIEVKDPGFGPAHLLAYVPDLSAMRTFSSWMAGHMKNVELSSQRIYATAQTLQDTVAQLGGIVIPAHIFTPHRSVYGSAASRMADFLNLDQIAAVELGLSADTAMAGMLSELDRFPFLSNSDAHSLAKIGREYNALRLAEPSFAEWVMALRGEAGRCILANYGLSPRLGKYHRSYCSQCSVVLDRDDMVTDRCPACGGRIVRGVMDRIRSIADRNTEEAHMLHHRNDPLQADERPPYIHQVPLEFIPGLGRRTLDKLLDHFGTEMNILHEVPQERLAEVAGADIASSIAEARGGILAVEVGGGGHYGRVKKARTRPGTDKS